MDVTRTTAGPRWVPDPAGIYFSDLFGVHPDVLDQYGALDVSVVADMPLFIDPFLLFNSDNATYQALHEQILEYLRFLREKAAPGTLDPGLLRAWYTFKEVKQNWLGFTDGGNAGHGLGPKFASALHAALGDVLLGNLGSETITRSSHLEKVALIQNGVGRDNISDFTTNLIKHFHLDYTEKFALEHLEPDQVKTVTVERATFNYTTESWVSRPYTLPWIEGGISGDGRHHPGDFVMLTPMDLLTRDDTWINRADMLSRCEQLPDAVPDPVLRAQMNNYLQRKLGADPRRQERAAARAATLAAFPELVDYYIALKEKEEDKARAVSIEKVRDTQRLLRDQVQLAAHDLREKTAFFEQPWTSYDEALAVVQIFKHYVEHQDGYLVLNRGDGKPFGSEKDVQGFFGLLLQLSRFDVNREPNNGRGPVDYKLSRGALDKTLIEFKLAKSSSLKRNLKNQVKVYEAANNTDQSVTVVIVYSQSDADRVARVFTEIDAELELVTGTTAARVVVVDARADNKPSASKV